jgi:hypothetical protein
MNIPVGRTRIGSTAHLQTAILPSTAHATGEREDERLAGREALAENAVLGN